MTAVVSGAQSYAIDPAHSSVEFAVKHMVISKVRGRFNSVGGSLSLTPGSDVPVAADVEIDAMSIETHDEARNGHLKSADFLHAENYPKLSFVSTSVTGEASSFELVGNLTIRETTKPVTLKASFDGRMTDPWGLDRVAYTADVTIDRREWGITWSQALETGGLLVGTDIKIEISIQATRKP
jgi:polyisoprenoid-binding protein YceI